MLFEQLRSTTLNVFFYTYDNSIKFYKIYLIFIKLL